MNNYDFFNESLAEIQKLSGLSSVSLFISQLKSCYDTVNDVQFMDGVFVME